MKHKLTIFLGAGSTMSAGLPGVNDITSRLEAIGEPGSPTARAGGMLFKQLKQVLTAQGFNLVHFELMLHALEILEPVTRGSGILPVDDYFRSLSQALLTPTVEANKLHDLGAMSYWRGLAFHQIATLIAEKLAASSVKEEHLSRIIKRLHSQADLRVYTLNYDDLIDRVGLPWRDGFVPNNSNFYEVFDPAQFLEDDRTAESLLVHLHGSTRFGYAQDGIIDIHKYCSPERALAFLSDKGFSQTVHGRIITAGPIISGLNKVEQLLYRPCPYGHYFRSLMNNLVENPRLLVLGYGGNDRHVNEWIGQFMQVHKKSSKIAIVGPVSNRAFIDYVLRFSHETPSARKQPKYYGTNLIIEPDKIPLPDDQLAKITDFLIR